MSKLTNFFASCMLLGAMANIQFLSGSPIDVNQTSTLSPVVVDGDLPYQVIVEQASFSLPSGIHSYASANYKGKWLFLAGRTNGLHDFNNNNNNFPPSAQNTTVFVVDPSTGQTFTKSLSDVSSGLSQEQIDTLSVTSPQAYRRNGTLYMTGGYGVDTASGNFNTKPVLTALDIEGVIHWVVTPSAGETMVQHIRQLTDPAFQVTGGDMYQSNDNLTLLIFGQNFDGFYVPESDGTYTRQVRRFKIQDNGKKLSVLFKDPIPEVPDPNFRRRDMNIVPVMHDLYGTPLPAYIAYSGVFTPEGGAWTVPVLIDYWGKGIMADPTAASTFKQAMNNYTSPFLSSYSNKTKTSYVTFFGGISYGYFNSGVFTTDNELPFINQITTVTLDKNGNYTQYLMNSEYPVILSTGSNPGNQLLFGAGAGFFLDEGISTFDREVLKLDKIGDESVVVGYIVGGIMSTLPNTNSGSDSTASPYVFKVSLVPTL